MKGNTVRGGEGGGAIESGGGEIHGEDVPAMLGEENGVVAGATCEIERAGVRAGRRDQRETFDEERGGRRGRLCGGFEVAGVPGVDVVGHEEENGLETEGRY